MCELMLGLLVSADGFATDHWSECRSGDGFAILEMDQLVLQDQGVIDSSFVTIETLYTLRSSEEYCTLRVAKRETIALFSETTVKKVTYSLEEDEIAPSVIYVICEEGYSGIPANDSCLEN